MKAENTTLTEKRVIAVQDGVHYYSSALPTNRMASGLYDMSAVRIGQKILPGFTPVAVTNDEPLDIDSTISDILKEFQDFFERRPIFKKLGFAHKRGYLLHGPPGCGKSCTLRLLQKRFLEKYDGIIIFWRAGAHIKDYVEHIRQYEPERPVMVICEDIDGFISHFEEKILEFLDGQQGLDNFLLVATTNNLGSIPDRIKNRPSRIDRVLEISKPSTQTRRNYLLALKVEPEQAADLAARTEGMTIAQLKEVVVATVALGQSLESVLTRLKVVVPDSSGSTEEKDVDWPDHDDPMTEMMRG